MSYDVSGSSQEQWYSFLDSTFGATTVSHYVLGPRGAVGFVRDIEVDVTTSLVGTSTVPEIDVGLSSGDSTFGRYRLGTVISTGYGVGVHRASQEAITGNIPRSLGDFAGHVVLDGGPYTSAGVAGGTFGTQIPAGRIPASPLTVTNVINGTGNVPRIFVKEDISRLLSGQTVTVQNVSGATGTNVSNGNVATINVPLGWFELATGTFGGTYTSGGLVFLVVYITSLLGTGGSPAGGGHVRVLIEWSGINMK